MNSFNSIRNSGLLQSALLKLLFLAVLFGISLVQAQEPEGVCVTVKLQLDHAATMTRKAFRTALEVNNQGSTAIADIKVTFDIQDVLRVSRTNVFAIRPPELSGLTGVEGSGILASAQKGRAEWILIPTREAAPDEPTRYFIGGELSYVQDGASVTVPLYPSPILVYPDPSLKVKYFHQVDVYSDDPFTPEIEPVEPFVLGLLMENAGGGEAKNVNITSAQPKIIENEKGLLIDFKVIGSQVGITPVSPSLSVSLGDIEPGMTAEALWLLTSSLQGRFIGFDASFEHLDSLGNTNISLVESIEIHRLVHAVRAMGTLDDGQLDFLCDDVDDSNALADTLYLSTGPILPVNCITNGQVQGTLSPNRTTVQLQANLSAGWSYLRIPDPGQDQYRLTRVTRSDGQDIILGTNVWTTHRTIRLAGQSPYRQHQLHLLDFNSPGVYTLIYGPSAFALDTNAPSSLVEALPATNTAVFAVHWSGQDNTTNSTGIASYAIYVSLDNGPYQAWLQATTDSGAVYQGAAGHSYSFYSIATDGARNVERAPNAPDTTTTIPRPNTAPVAGPWPAQSIAENQPWSWTLPASDPDLPKQELSFSLLDPFPDGLVISANGIISWTPDEAQGPSTNTIRIRVADNGTPSLSSTGQLTIVVQEVNRAPFLQTSANLVVEEMISFVATNLAFDPDYPANTLSYALVSAPSGCTVNPITGIISWTPRESQGPSTNTIVIRVSDDGTPSLSTTNSFAVVVKEVNRAPVLTVPTNQVVDELVALTLTNSVIDQDLPANRLTFELLDAPAGAELNSVTGVFNWTPSEAQGPSTNTILIRSLDDGTPSLSATNSFDIIVREVNRPPSLLAIPTQVVPERSVLTVTNRALDSDLPANWLVFELIDAPSGAVLNATNGVLTWMPTEIQGPSINTITLRVRDNGIPRLRATNSFTVVVEEANQPPILTGPTNLVVNEQTLLCVTNVANDSDWPAQQVHFELGAETPEGIVLDNHSGVLTWIPDEHQGPSTNQIEIIASDDGSPSCRTTNRVTVVVREVNEAPVLIVPETQVIRKLATLVVTNLATDADWPANQLAFSLIAAPTGVNIDPASGVLTWAPTAEQSPSANLITVKVADNGRPRLSATNSFVVVVEGGNAPPRVALIQPIDGAEFAAPANIQLLAEAEDIDGDIVRVEFYKNARWLATDRIRPYAFAWTNVPAGEYTLIARAVDREGAATDSDRVVIRVSDGQTIELSDLRLLPNRQLEFVAHGKPSAIYAVESSDDLRSWSAILTNRAGTTGIAPFSVQAELGKPHRFYRAKEVSSE